MGVEWVQVVCSPPQNDYFEKVQVELVLNDFSFCFFVVLRESNEKYVSLFTLLVADFIFTPSFYFYSRR